MAIHRLLALSHIYFVNWLNTIPRRSNLSQLSSAGEASDVIAAFCQQWRPEALHYRQLASL